jgi:hypothetical protein
LWSIRFYNCWEAGLAAWKSRRDDFPTAGKALGLGFILVFNIYWLFVVAPKLGKLLHNEMLYTLGIVIAVLNIIGYLTLFAGPFVAIFECLLIIGLSHWYIREASESARNLSA